MPSRAAPAILGLLLLVEGPFEDPFVAVATSGAALPAVAAPRGDPDLDAVSWTTRTRDEIVDGLGAALLRGDGSASGAAAPLAPPPPRVPATFVPLEGQTLDRLAAWAPADSATAFFDSLAAAEDAVAGLSTLLPRAFPGPCGDGPAGRRDSLRRATEMLLIPTIWRSNPGVRTGTRAAALVADDPDLRNAPDVALVLEVDDASLVLAHRRASFAWESRHRDGFRVEGLDAWTDDGTVRSYCALDGGVVVFATTKSLRARVLAAGTGAAPSLAKPRSRELALARAAFPPVPGAALLVVPDAFLARISAPAFRARRAASLRCQAARLLIDAASVAATRGKVSMYPTMRLSCPSGGCILARADGPGARCSIHGDAVAPVPLGDLPAAAPTSTDLAALARLAASPDAVLSGALPLAAEYRPAGTEMASFPGTPSLGLLVPGEAAVPLLLAWSEARRPAWLSPSSRSVRRSSVLSPGGPTDAGSRALERLTGLLPPEGPTPVEALGGPWSPFSIGRWGDWDEYSWTEVMPHSFAPGVRVLALPGPRRLGILKWRGNSTSTYAVLEVR